MAKQRRQRRRKPNKGMGLLAGGLCLLWALSFLVRWVTEHREAAILLAGVFIGCFVLAKWALKRRKERKRQLFRKRYGYEQEIQELMLLVNQLLHLEKSPTASTKKTKQRTMRAYRQLLERTGKGFVYFVQEKAGGTVKIGKALDPYERIVKGFGVKIPLELGVLYLIRTDHDYLLERRFHQHFSSQRVNGEWFHLSERDMEWILSRDYPLEMLELMS